MEVAGNWVLLVCRPCFADHFLHWSAGQSLIHAESVIVKPEDMRVKMEDLTAGERSLPSTIFMVLLTP